MRAADWASTPLGAPAGWPQSLRTAVRIMLDSRYAMWMAWGDGLPFLYNDAYRPTLGIKHPRTLGMPASQVWAEIWGDIGPRIEHVLRTGEATWDENLLLFLERSGFPEETYHSFSYSPLYDDDGEHIRGMLCVVTEETERRIGARRTALLRDMAMRMADSRTTAEAGIEGLAAIAGDLCDIPFAVLYRIDPQARAAVRVAVAGIDTHHPAAPDAIGFDDFDLWPIGDCVRMCETRRVDALGERFGDVPHGKWAIPAQSAVLSPLRLGGSEVPDAVLVTALNPHRAFDAEDAGFIGLVAGQIAAAMGVARGYEDAQRRVVDLAELDRAKTAFFSNISHEFRTPLTLMLGPLQDVLEESPIDAETRDTLEVAHRNTLRLQKLVNTLLQFSRIEAGGLQVQFEPVELATTTADIASSFRSAFERAGVVFEIDCPPLSRPVRVDQDMWEKVVLNLLSNAFKHTFEGSVSVVMREVDGFARMTVRDTGTGVPAADVPHLFARFRRVEGARGRSQEGSGIGLALVQELVRLHGGTIRVDSTVDVGTTLTVDIPLAADGGGSQALAPRRQTRDGGFVQEALRWLPGPESRDDKDALRQAGLARPIVVVADDNADLREYLRTLLSVDYHVITANDGREALAAVRAYAPVLVLSDVLMPVLDGFELLRELRSSSQTQSVPVILLSARAGEEGRLEGLRAGADDYILKPFSARELLARVTAVIGINAYRREATRREVMLEREKADVVEALGDAYMSVAPSWTIRYVNAAMERAVVMPRDMLLGRNVWDAFPTLAASTSFSRALRATMSDRVTRRIEHLHEESQRWYEVDVAPAQEGHINVFGRDITRRLKSIQALRDSEHLLRNVADTAPAMLWVTDTSNVCTFLSRAWYDFTGQTVREAEGFGWLDAVHPDHRAMAGETFVAASTRREEFTMEHPLRRADGEYRWVVDAGRPRFADDGEWTGYVGSVLDVDDRRRAAEMLAQSERMYRLLFESIDEGFCIIEVIFDAAGKAIDYSYVEANPEFFPQSGFYDAIGKRMRELAPDHEQSWYDTYGDVARTGQPVRFQRYSAALARWFDSYAFPLGEPGSNRVAVLFRNITEKRQIAERQAASELRYRTLFETIEDGFAIIEVIRDATGAACDCRFIDINPAFERHSGLVNACGRTALELVPSLEPEWIAIYGEVERTGEAKRFSLGAQALGRWFDVYATRLDNGSHSQVALLFSDVTEQRRGAEALAKSEERYRTLFESIDDGFCLLEIILDDAGRPADYRFIDANPGFYRQTDLTDDVIGRAVRDIFPQVEEVWIQTLGQVGITGEPVRFDDHTQDLDRWLSVNAMRIGDPELRHVAVVFSDITERKRQERALQDAARLKDEFLATLAHELRNPLAPIATSLHLLETNTDPATVDRLHTIMRRQVTQLSRLVDDLMEVSRVTRGRIELCSVSVDLVGIIGDAVDASRGLVEAGGHVLDVDLPGEPLRVLGDPVRLVQVFTNLLNNAARYTERGGRIRIRLLREDDMAVVRVNDSGIGIAAEEIDTIFELFSQGRRRGGEQGGLGIGLTLARSLVQMHGGTLVARSDGPGRGSEFTARLPLQPRAPVAAPRAATLQSSTPLAGLRVVVADDNEDAAAALRMWLEAVHAEPIVVHDGGAAVEAIETSGARVALLDLGMPVLDGLEVARRVRATHAHGDLLLIAVTGWGQADDRARTREAGFDAHLTKPADMDTLHSMLVPWAERQARLREPPPA